MYQALYRKWRPRTFDEVCSQQHITETLKNQIISGRLSHAYLFTGTRGTGKTSCAKILAKAVNCEHPENGNPCNKCKSCLGIDDGSILDVVELDAASNNGVDNVRALRDEAIFSPVSVKKRVYIIDEVHMLSSSAFNALLKILEEPPEHLLFILATTELHKVPATILSRCQRHSFKRITPDDLAARLSFIAEQENMRVTPDAASLLARLADGALRDGVSLLDQCSGFEIISADNVLSAMGLAGNLRIAELLGEITDGKTEKALAAFGRLWNDGKAPATLLNELSVLLRDILMLKVAPKGGRELLSGGFDDATLKDFAAKMSAEELISGIDATQKHLASLRDGRDPKTTAELCIIGLCEPNLGDSVDVLKKRIAKLESNLENVFVQKVHNEDIPFKKRTVEKTVVHPDDETPPFALEEVDERLPVETPEKPDEIEEFAEKDTINADNGERVSLKDSALEADEEPESARQSEGDAEVWVEILKKLKGLLGPGQFSLVSNSAMVKGSFDGASVNISAADDFVRGQLEQNTVLAFLREGALEVIGRSVPVKICVDDALRQPDPGKLSGLAKFGNVTFK